MRIMSRLCAPLYHLLIGALLCLPLVASALDVALVMSQSSGSAQAFAEAFTTAAVASGHRVAQVEKVGGVLDEAALAGADLVIANGEAALAAVLSKPSRPTLGVMLGRARFDALSARHPQAELSAFTLDQPAARQLRLLRAVLPKSEHVGALFGDAQAGAKPLQEAAAASGFDLAAATVASEAELITRLEAVLRRSDAFVELMGVGWPPRRASTTNRWTVLLPTSSTPNRTSTR